MAAPILLRPDALVAPAPTAGGAIAAACAAAGGEYFSGCRFGLR